MSKLILFNKPFQVLSQFTSEGTNKATLAQYINIKDIYAAGRLDFDSEGLLLLTDDGQLQHRIAHPNHKSPKTYWVQVEGQPSPESLETLRNGVNLKDGLTLPAQARVITPPLIWERKPPIRERQCIPTTWLEIIITEGKNRQVRRMTAAVGYPTLRLIRTQIGDWSLGQLQPGEMSIIEVDSLSQGRQPKSPFKQKRKPVKIRKPFI